MQEAAHRGGGAVVAATAANGFAISSIPFSGAATRIVVGCSCARCHEGCGCRCCGCCGSCCSGGGWGAHVPASPVSTIGMGRPEAVRSAEARFVLPVTTVVWRRCEQRRISPHKNSKPKTTADAIIPTGIGMTTEELPPPPPEGGGGTYGTEGDGEAAGCGVTPFTAVAMMTSQEPPSGLGFGDDGLFTRPQLAGDEGGLHQPQPEPWAKQSDAVWGARPLASTAQVSYTKMTN